MNLSFPYSPILHPSTATLPLLTVQHRRGLVIRFLVHLLSSPVPPTRDGDSCRRSSISSRTEIDDQILYCVGGAAPSGTLGTELMFLAVAIAAEFPEGGIFTTGSPHHLPFSRHADLETIEHS